MLRSGEKMGFYLTCNIHISLLQIHGCWQKKWKPWFRDKDLSTQGKPGSEYIGIFTLVSLVSKSVEGNIDESTWMILYGMGCNIEEDFGV